MGGDVTVKAKCVSEVSNKIVYDIELEVHTEFSNLVTFISLWCSHKAVMHACRDVQRR